MKIFPFFNTDLKRVNILKGIAPLLISDLNAAKNKKGENTIEEAIRVNKHCIQSFFDLNLALIMRLPLLSF